MEWYPAPLSVTLNDLYPRVQGHAIIRRCISQKWCKLQWTTIQSISGKQL